MLFKNPPDPENFAPQGVTRYSHRNHPAALLGTAYIRLPFVHTKAADLCAMSKPPSLVEDHGRWIRRAYLLPDNIHIALPVDSASISASSIDSPHPLESLGLWTEVVYHHIIFSYVSKNWCLAPWLPYNLLSYTQRLSTVLLQLLAALARMPAKLAHRHSIAVNHPENFSAFGNFLRRWCHGSLMIA